MSVEAFNHFNIHAPRPVLEDGKNFQLEVIGFTEGFRPDVPIHGSWLSVEDLAVLHLMGWNIIAETPKYEKGYLDHIAFSSAPWMPFIQSK